MRKQERQVKNQMTDYALAVAGILLTAVLFWITHHKTTGARQTRQKEANVQLVRILVRRIAMDGCIPNEVDVLRLTEGKARDYRVSAAELLSTDELLSMVYTRIVESDLISAEQRDGILSRIAPVLAELEVRSFGESEVEAMANARRASRIRDGVSFVVSATASILGGLTVIIPRIVAPGEGLVVPANVVASGVIIAVGSVAIIGLIWVVMWSRARQDGGNDAGRLVRGAALESEVRRILESVGATSVFAGRDVDFLVEYKGRKIAIEVKAGSQRIPRAVLSSMVQRLRRTAEGTGASEVIVVVPVGARILRKRAETEGVKVFVAEELERYLENLPS